MRVNDLIELEERGELPEFVLFWGGKKPKGCLTQWYPSPFTLDGVAYPTAEHYMMAEKARLFGDTAAVDKILADPDPGRAKGPRPPCQGLRRADVGAGTLRHRGPGQPGVRRARRLRDFLFSTTGKVLVEASPHDTVWGIGFDEHQPKALRPSQWSGLNLLGFALMDAREALKT